MKPIDVMAYAIVTLAVIVIVLAIIRTCILLNTFT